MILSISIQARADDTDWSACDPIRTVAPEGAMLENQENCPGFVSGRILWYPSQYQTGLHDIHLVTQDVDAGRTNSALATIRLKVNP